MTDGGAPAGPPPQGASGSSAVPVPGVERPAAAAASATGPAPVLLSASPPAPSRPSEAPVSRLRLRFRKGGDLRFLSHRDLLRLFERSARSAGLPLAYTEGFHPHPRIAIVQALTLGVTGEAEVCEVDLAAPMDPEAMRTAWQRQMPEGFVWNAVREVPRGGSPARVITAHWRVRFPAPGDLAARVDALLAAATAIVVRALPPPSREVDVRHSLESCAVVPDGVAFALRLDADGSARPDEVLRALGCTPDPADAETVRTGLDLADETGLDWGRRMSPTVPGGARRVAPAKPAEPTGPDAWPREFKLSDLAE